MNRFINNINDYLTWNPEVLAYTGMTILGMSVITGFMFLIGM